jgi:hypothetical protein
VPAPTLPSPPHRGKGQRGSHDTPSLVLPSSTSLPSPPPPSPPLPFPLERPFIVPANLSSSRRKRLIKARQSAFSLSNLSLRFGSMVSDFYPANMGATASLIAPHLRQGMLESSLIWSLSRKGSAPCVRDPYLLRSSPHSLCRGDRSSPIPAVESAPVCLPPPPLPRQDLRPSRPRRLALAASLLERDHNFFFLPQDPLEDAPDWSLSSPLLASTCLASLLSSPMQGDRVRECSITRTPSGPDLGRSSTPREWDH